MKLTRVTTKTEQGGWGAHAFRVAGQQSGSGNAEHLLFIHHAGEGKGGTWSFAGPAGRLLWSPELELTLTETSLINQLLFWHGTSGSPAKCPKTHNKNFVLFPHHGLKLRWELTVGRRTWEADAAFLCVHQVMGWTCQTHPLDPHCAGTGSGGAALKDSAVCC